MRTLELYSFSELSKQMQLVALENNRQRIRDEQMNTSDLFDETIKDKTDYLEDNGFNDVKILYSGFGSQGDGLCFTCDNVNLDLLISKLFPEYKRLIEVYNLGELRLSIYHNSNYYHERSSNINFEYDLNEYQNILERVENFESIFSTWYYNFCKDVYKQLEIEDEFYYSDEFIKDIIIASDYYFTENGKLINF